MLDLYYKGLVVLLGLVLATGITFGWFLLRKKLQVSKGWFAVWFYGAERHGAQFLSKTVYFTTLGELRRALLVREHAPELGSEGGVERFHVVADTPYETKHLTALVDVVPVDHLDAAPWKILSAVLTAE